MGQMGRMELMGQVVCSSGTRPFNFCIHLTNLKTSVVCSFRRLFACLLKVLTVSRWTCLLFISEVGGGREEQGRGRNATWHVQNWD